MKKKLLTLLFIALILLPFAAVPATALAQGVEDECWGGIYDGFNVAACIRQALGVIAEMVLRLCALFLKFAGKVLDTSINFTIVNMADQVNGSAGINTVWSTFRDVANMFFIFILLYIAIMTILRGTGFGTKKLLVAVIITAVLLNFSLFFTKIMIDVSNSVAIAFYNQIASSSSDGLSGAFMGSVNLQSLYSGVGNPYDENSQPGQAFYTSTWYEIIAVGTFGSAFILTTAFIFLALGILLVIRYVILLILMAFSALAFAAMALPKDKFSGQWWDSLWNQLLFPPILMMMLYATLKITEALFRNNGSLKESFLSANGSLEPVLNFVVIIALMVCSLVIAKKLGATGASTAMSWGKSITGKARGAAGDSIRATGRNTFGRAANAFAESNLAKGIAARDFTGLSRLALKGARSTGAGYAESLEKRTKARTEFSESLGYDRNKVAKQQEELSGNISDLNTLKTSLASANAAGNTTVAAQLQRRITQKEAQISQGKAAIEKTKFARQEAYAGSINPKARFLGVPGTGKVRSLFHKVAGSSNDRATATIIVTKRRSELKKHEEDLKDIKSESKNLREKAKSNQTLTQQETTDLAEFERKIASTEEKVRNTKTEITKLEIVAGLEPKDKK